MKDTGLAFGAMLVRAGLQWLSGILLALCLMALFFAINVYQLTDADTAQRILARAVATLTEIDALLPAIRADLTESVQTGDSPTVTVPLFPIPVELTRQEATAISPPSCAPACWTQRRRKCTATACRSSPWVTRKPSRTSTPFRPRAG